MSGVEVLGLTAERCIELLDRRDVSCRELAEAYLDRIDRVDGDLHCFLRTRRESTLAEAEALDRDGRSGLQGVPVTLKDILSTRGEETTAGSRILEGHLPLFDAGAVTRLREAGTVVIGKTNMDEFAMGSSTENSAYGVTHNPWDPARVPGGSSGGSSAAVAAGLAPIAYGTDTGGSIRQPAALCGVVGMKPTYGAVSRHGLIAFASSLDQIGPFALTVRDCALALAAVAGHDRCDSTSVPLPEPVRVPDAEDLRGVTIGVPEALLAQGVEPGVRESFDAALRLAEGMGATLREVELPHAGYGLPAYYIIAPAEASSNLARFDGVRYGLRVEEAGDTVVDMYERTRAAGFGAEVKRRIMLGTYALSSGYYEAYYGTAQRVRTLIRRDFDTAFAGVDLIATPTSPTVAFEIGERANDPWAMYASDVLTVPVNLAGLPGISIPSGLAGGLPVGFQLIGPAFAENRILDAAHALERAIAFDPVPPRLGASA
ncbi:MAG TPA: Asp-tRNA(Asn)/Glu-tRNA(Gln) amidotransferase subunit GatA [Gaiellales bacterium]|nr:Asp-tRNA(Asn)/Glu-tRNA(Gln) amidotransferase subunit GatA [Gaiellales bacterium]